jgi:hypothetical protein
MNSSENQFPRISDFPFLWWKGITANFEKEEEKSVLREIDEDGGCSKVLSGRVETCSPQYSLYIASDTDRKAEQAFWYLRTDFVLLFFDQFIFWLKGEHGSNERNIWDIRRADSANLLPKSRFPER